MTEQGLEPSATGLAILYLPTTSNAPCNGFNSVPIYWANKRVTGFYFNKALINMVTDVNDAYICAEVFCWEEDSKVKSRSLDHQYSKTVSVHSGNKWSGKKKCGSFC